MGDPGFKRGMDFLAKHDLVFESTVFPAQLLKGIALTFPKNKIVLNHLGTPPGPRSGPR